MAETARAVGATQPMQRKIATLLAQAIASALLLGTFAKAALEVALTWDVWYYHLPFAARLWGIVPSDTFVFHAANHHRYDGFPLLGEALQGLLWRVVGRPEAANFLAWGSVVAYVAFLQRVFRVPWALSTIALFAIPLVMAHATSCYVDLPANLALSALLLITYRLWVDPASRPSRAFAVSLVGAAAIAANMRFQLVPLVGLSLAVAAPRLFRGQPWPRIAGAAGLALVVVFATPLKNLTLHHNPFFPVTLALPGITLAGAENAYSDAPAYLEHAPAPLRFACSLLEMGIRPLTNDSRWTVDQWMPPASGGNRMGGFFHLYVVAALVVLLVLTRRYRSRASRGALVLMGALTLVVSFSPQSHELRYYLAWMIVLVSLNLVVACRQESAAASGVVGGMSAFALGAVLLVTRAWYIYPTPYPFPEVLERKVLPFAIQHITDGETMCVARSPWNFLYAASFPPPRRYVVREAEEPTDCKGAPSVE